MKKSRKAVAFCGLLLAASLSLGGCSTKGGLKIVLTGGLSGNELFAVNKETMTLPEAKLLLMTELARYRNLYGEEMLSRQFGGQTLEESVKESTLSLLGKILVMDEMADKYQIRLSQEDEDNIVSASAEYAASLTEEEQAFTGATESDVQQLFEKALLADRVYAELTGEQNIEVSDDEARVVTVRHIFIKTDSSGSTADTSGSQDEEASADDSQTQAAGDAYSRAMAVFDQLQQGADFDSMAQQYSDDTQEEYQVARGDVDEKLEEVLFSLDTGELSTVQQNSTGYHIFLCVNNFDRDATEQNKQKLLEERRWAAFEQTYNAFAKDQVCQFSQRKWDAITLDGEEITNTGLYDVYRSWFGG